MTDEAKALVERLRDDLPQTLIEKHWVDDHDAIYKQREEAADYIETQAREIERLKEAIKVQARAVRTLQANEETEINTLRQQKQEWHHAVSSLDSEREANAILTDEIERLREALGEICTDSNPDWTEKRVYPNEVLDDIHTIAVNAYYKVRTV